MRTLYPFILEVDDYHEFEVARKYFRMIDGKIRVKEIAFDGMYLGMVYKGPLTAPENKKMIEELKARDED